MQGTKQETTHMKIIRTNLPLGITVLLALLTILLVIIAVPFLIIVVLCWLVRCALTGGSPTAVFSDLKDRRRSRIYEGPFQQEQSRREEEDHPASGDDTIECEILSARTFDENGQEIR